MGNGPLVKGYIPFVSFSVVWDIPHMTELDVLKREMTRRMRAQDYTAIKLAIEAGLPRDSIRDIFRGHSKAPSVFTVAAAANQLGCSIEELLGKARPDGLDEEQAHYRAPPMQMVAALDVLGSAGGGANVETENVIGTFAFPPGEFDAPGERLRIITVLGDSMMKPGDPSSLHPGDRVVVDTGMKSPSPPGIFALFDGTGLVIKCVEILPKGKRLRVFSLNPNYREYDLTPGEAHIQGRVRGLWRKI